MECAACGKREVDKAFIAKCPGCENVYCRFQDNAIGKRNCFRIHVCHPPGPGSGKNRIR